MRGSQNQNLGKTERLKQAFTSMRQFPGKYWVYGLTVYYDTSTRFDTSDLKHQQSEATTEGRA